MEESVKTLVPKILKTCRAHVEAGELDAAYAALHGTPGFFAWSLRGWIRSLGMRLEEARECFDEASRRIARAAFTPRTLGQVARHVAMVRELAIVTGHPADFPLPIDLLDEEARRTHAALDAWEKLNRGDLDAERAFRAVLETGGTYGQRGFAILGLACALQAQDRTGEALLALESTGLYTLACQSRMDAGRLAARLWAVYGHVGDIPHSEEWMSYILRLGLPEGTMGAVLRRASLIRERSQPGRLVLV